MKLDNIPWQPGRCVFQVLPMDTWIVAKYYGYDVIMDYTWFRLSASNYANKFLNKVMGL